VGKTSAALQQLNLSDRTYDCLLTSLALSPTLAADGDGFLY
jgi:hypothetical protein